MSGFRKEEVANKITIIENFIEKDGGEKFSWTIKDMDDADSVIPSSGGSRECAEIVKRGLGKAAKHVDVVCAMHSTAHQKEAMMIAADIASILGKTLHTIDMVMLEREDLTKLLDKKGWTLRTTLFVIPWEDSENIEVETLRKFDREFTPHVFGFVIIERGGKKLPDDSLFKTFKHCIEVEYTPVEEVERGIGVDYDMLIAYEFLERKALSEGKNLEPVKVGPTGALYSTKHNPEMAKAISEHTPFNIGLTGGFILHDQTDVKGMVVCRGGYPLFADEPRNGYYYPVKVTMTAKNKEQAKKEVFNKTMTFFEKRGILKYESREEFMSKGGAGYWSEENGIFWANLESPSNFLWIEVHASNDHDMVTVSLQTTRLYTSEECTKEFEEWVKAIIGELKQLKR